MPLPAGGEPVGGVDPLPIDMSDCLADPEGFADPMGDCLTNPGGFSGPRSDCCCTGCAGFVRMSGTFGRAAADMVGTLAMHLVHTRNLLVLKGTVLEGQHFSQKIPPQMRQWCLLVIWNIPGFMTVPQAMHVEESLSSIQYFSGIMGVQIPGKSVIIAVFP